MSRSASKKEKTNSSKEKTNSSKKEKTKWGASLLPSSSNIIKVLKSWIRETGM
jgi:hypothetical protein